MNIPRIGEDRTTRLGPATIAAGVSLSAILVLLYAETVAWMFERWTAPASYFSHGLLVPAISLFFAWKARGRVRWGEDPVAVRGGAALLSGAFLCLVGAFARVHFLTAVSLVPVAAGILMLFGGLGAWRPLRFPVFYLLFLVPWPLWAVANLSLSLKLVTAEAALRVANSAGIVAIRDGATIHLAAGMGSLEVGDACSGLRYSVSLLAFGAVLAMLSKNGRAGRIAVFAAALPAAILANSIRVLLLVWGGSVWGAEAVSGTIHDASGILVFVFAFLLLGGLDRLVGRFSRGGS